MSASASLDPTKGQTQPAISSPSQDSGVPQLDKSVGSTGSTGTLSHRSSFAEGMRPHPPSPRTQRHPSITQGSAVQDLLNHPPVPKKGDSRYKGRDWRKITIGEIANRDDVRFVERSTSVEEATKILVDSGAPHVVLIRDDPSSLAATGTFDYGNLNAYLLVVLGLAQPEPEMADTYTEIARKAREGVKIPLGDVLSLAKKAPIVSLPQSAVLSEAIEFFAGGVHRILIVKEGTDEVIGLFSQWKLMNFLWENGSCFSVIDQLYPRLLNDLHIGTHQIIAINGDKPLTEALLLMNSEGLSSVAVVDNAQNVIGNISVVDVRHLTKTSSLPLLQSSCIHFISVILMERGAENGKDTFPVFYVTPQSTLAHTVAKLVATTSQRMWVTDSPSPSTSTPATPQSVPSVLTAAPLGSTTGSPPISPAFPSISAAAFPGSRMSGKLSGVISLTDVLNLFARESGLQTQDPSEERQHRRRSSSISSLQRPSMDSARGSSVDVRR